MIKLYKCEKPMNAASYFERLKTIFKLFLNCLVLWQTTITITLCIFQGRLTIHNGLNTPITWKGDSASKFGKNHIINLYFYLFLND